MQIAQKKQSDTPPGVQVRGTPYMTLSIGGCWDSPRSAEKVDAQLQHPTNHIPLMVEDLFSLDSAVAGWGSGLWEIL